MTCEPVQRKNGPRVNVSSGHALQISITDSNMK